MRRTWALVAVAIVILVAHSLVWNFVTDDAFISFVYSRNLAEHGQLVFNLGERVEGYTNFLWTVILAGFYKIGAQPEIVARVLGTLCGAAGLAVAARLSRRLRGGDWSAWDALPALLLAGVPGYACWSSGGLETQLFTLLTTLGFTFHIEDLLDDKRTIRSAAAFGLAALTRPEGFLFFALVELHRRLVTRKLVTRADVRAAAVFLVLVVPHLLWRRWYYGWWVPNTFFIKASGMSGTWPQGGYYLLRFAQAFHLWAPVAVILTALAVGKRARGTLLWALCAVVFCVYVASVGGDFMGLYRFMMPIVPLTFVVASVALWQLVKDLDRVVQIALPAVLLAGHGLHAFIVDKASLVVGADRGIDTPGFLRRYTADRAAIGKWFGQYAQPDDFAAVGGAGAQVWYSRIPSLDCFGLSDAFVAHKTKALQARPGHQKYAPLDYQLSRHPTIITSNYYRWSYDGPFVPSPGEVQMWRSYGYHYVSVQIPGLQEAPWYAFLLRDDRTLGPFPALKNQEP
jgi:hypothetical protein